MILAFSARKQGGKNTCTNFILGLRLLQNKSVRDFIVSEQTGGTLYVQKWQDDNFYRLDKQFIDPNFSAKVYSFADNLKEICVKTLGLKREHIYGTDVQKNLLTKYEWKNMPGLAQSSFAGRTGFMSNREILEYVGTVIFRSMYDDVWIDSCLDQIHKNTIIFEQGQLSCYDPWNMQLFLLDDTRFPNEVKKIHQIGGKVVRLARDPHHAFNSIECALDQDRYDWSNFDFVIHNQYFTIEDTLKALYKKVLEWQIVDVEYDFSKERSI